MTTTTTTSSSKTLFPLVISKLIKASEKESTIVFLNDYLTHPDQHSHPSEILRLWSIWEKGNPKAIKAYQAALKVLKQWEKPFLDHLDEPLTLSRNLLELMSQRKIESFTNKKEQFIVDVNPFEPTDGNLFILKCIRNSSINLKKLQSNPIEKLHQLASLYTQFDLLLIPSLAEECITKMIEQFKKASTEVSSSGSEHFNLIVDLCIRYTSEEGFNPTALDLILGYVFSRLNEDIDLNLEPRAQELYGLLAKSNFIRSSEPYSVQNFKDALLGNESVLTHALKLNGLALGFIPLGDRTESLCTTAVQENPLALIYVPDPLRQNPKLYLLAIQKDSETFDFLPKSFRNAATYLEAVKLSGYALSKIPTDEITKEMCLAALEHKSNAFRYVPKELRTLEMEIKELKTNCSQSYSLPSWLNPLPIHYLALVEGDGENLSLVPDIYLTDEIYLAAVKQNGRNLEDIPVDHLTPEICMAAVKQDGFAIFFVPKDLITEDMCTIAAENFSCSPRVASKDGRSSVKMLEHYFLNKRETRELPNPKLYLAAVKNDAEAFLYVPESHRTQKVCFNAIKQLGELFLYVPKEEHTAKLCLKTVQKMGCALKWIPKNFHSPELFQAAIEEDGNALEYIPLEDRTEERCIAAIQNNGNAIRFVPEKFLTPSMYLTAVQNYYNLELVPEALRTPEMYLAAVQKNWQFLSKIPENQLSKQICLAALKQSNHAYYNIPARIRDDEIEAVNKKYSLDWSIRWTLIQNAR